MLNPGVFPDLDLGIYCMNKEFIIYSIIQIFEPIFWYFDSGDTFQTLQEKLRLTYQYKMPSH